MQNGNSSAPTFVSVCIPVFNGEAYIRDTIQSVLDQTYGHFEIIITDNCSTDETADIIRSFHDGRIRYFLNERNLGMAGNWNRAVHYATGDYIKLLCADDLLHPTALERQAAALDRNPAASIVFGSTAIIDDEGACLHTRRYFRHDRLLDGRKLARRSLRGRNIIGEPSNTLYTRKAFDAAGGYDTAFVYCTDWDFNLRMAYLGQACYLADVLTYYRVSLSSETSSYYRNRRKALLDDTIQIFTKHRELHVVRLSAFDCLRFRLKSHFFMNARWIFLSVCLSLGHKNDKAKTTHAT